MSKNNLGALDMFSIGIGPSSSHTIGPMRASKMFIDNLEENNFFDRVTNLKIHLFGSLALTGQGHGTVPAVLSGLCGEDPKTVKTDKFINMQDEIKLSNIINLANKKLISFVFDRDLCLHKTEFLPEHANGMRFIAYDSLGDVLSIKEYFSVGGGFIVTKEDMAFYYGKDTTQIKNIPYPFKTATELFNICAKNNITIAELVTQNELHRKTREELEGEALEIINVMHESIERGLHADGVLPGGLAVRRRAPGLYNRLKNKDGIRDGRLFACCFAMAVNEENASFSRIVTAPTNGSAGTIAGVLEYYRNFCEDVTEDKLIEFILTAGAIGMLYKFGASISAAEVGCQGEIGVACSMAAGALTAVLGGTLIQIEKAAEIGMEHNLGMTCDPVDGLVQIPCIERNGLAASKAIDIANLALNEDEPGKISLDRVIRTMLQTGKDMGSKYKETSLGGLAVNIVNC